MNKTEEEFFKQAERDEADRAEFKKWQETKRRKITTKNPIQPPVYRTPPQAYPVQTVERTSKTWKGLGCLGVLLMLIGFPVVFVGNFYVGAGLLATGVAAYLYSKVMSWWCNG